jgi:hypothetical protein
VKRWSFHWSWWLGKFRLSYFNDNESNAEIILHVVSSTNFLHSEDYIQPRRSNKLKVCYNITQLTFRASLRNHQGITCDTSWVESMLCGNLFGCGVHVSVNLRSVLITIALTLRISCHSGIAGCIGQGVSSFTSSVSNGRQMVGVEGPNVCYSFLSVERLQDFLIN